MFKLELNGDGILRREVMQEVALYFTSGNYRKNVYWLIGVLICISQNPPKIANVRYFNNLC